jgi:2-polyprenyl-3-methyl-5-hydroxy-6-metoxy-1,4-benzoquinol methylase
MSEKHLHLARQYWDDAAASFDDKPDHGLRDPRVRQAWVELLRGWLPATQSTILDVGCGTGSISLILAESGHTVTGIDISSAMIAQARSKADSQGLTITFQVMDAAAPQFTSRSFDVITCRHMLWTLPEPAQVLQRWANLLKPGGRLILIEGYWATSAGLHAQEIAAALPQSMSLLRIYDLSDQPCYWGKEVSDERFAVIADLLQPQPKE